MIENEPKIINKEGYGGWTALMYAAHRGYAEITAELLKVPGIKVNEAKSNGRTALILAIHKGNAETTAELLNVKGIDVNTKSNSGYTPLMSAVERGHVNIVRQLLKISGIKINEAKSDGWTALMIAAFHGNAEIIAELLNVEGINVNKKSNSGHTPLMAAVERGHINIVRQLLQVTGIKKNTDIRLSEDEKKRRPSSSSGHIDDKDKKLPRTKESVAQEKDFIMQQIENFLRFGVYDKQIMKNFLELGKDAVLNFDKLALPAKKALIHVIDEMLHIPDSDAAIRNDVWYENKIQSYQNKSFVQIEKEYGKEKRDKEKIDHTSQMLNPLRNAVAEKLKSKEKSLNIESIQIP